MISVKKLYKTFGKNQVLKGLDMDFKQSHITAVLGPNSSGKTTLMKSLLGMVIPDSGQILVDDVDIKNNCDYRNKIGYLPQIARFPENLKVIELLDMIRELRQSDASCDTLLDYFELKPFINERLGYLSGGTRQKVNIVQALMFDCPYLLLDEPTVGLDPLSLIRLKDLILKERGKKKTILITSHIMSFVEEMADEVIFILDGKIYFSGHPQKIKKEYGSYTLERAIAKVLSGMPKLGHANGHSRKDEILVPMIKADHD